MDVQSWLQHIDFERLPYALVVIAVAMAAAHFLTRFLDDLGETFTDRRLFFKKTAALSRFAILLVAIVIVVTSLVRLEQPALIAVAGTLGLAFGIGFKDILASISGGILLILDAPFHVGDRISFGSYYGEVKSIGLRSVQLVTLDDNTVTIPNSRFLTEPVASANDGALECMVVVPFYVGAGEDFEAARRIVAEATATSRYVYLVKPLVTLVSDEVLGERFVTVIRVKAYVFDVRYEKAFASDVTERVKRAFREAGIRTPDQQVRDDLADPRGA